MECSHNYSEKRFIVMITNKKILFISFVLCLIFLGTSYTLSKQDKALQSKKQLFPFNVISQFNTTNNINVVDHSQKKRIRLFEQIDLNYLANLKILSTQANITLIPSSEKTLKIELSGYTSVKNPKEIFNIKQDNDDLIININKQQKKANNVFTVNFNNSRDQLDLKVYVPTTLEIEFTQLQSISGKIKIKDFNTEALNILSTSGKVDLKNVFTESTEIKTISGNVYIDQSSGLRLFESISGDLLFSQETKSFESDLFLKTTSGDVTLQYLDSSNFSLYSKTISGEVDSDFDHLTHKPLNNKTVKEQLKLPQIRFVSISGDLKIKKMKSI